MFNEYAAMYLSETVSQGKNSGNSSNLRKNDNPNVAIFSTKCFFVFITECEKLV